MRFSVPTLNQKENHRRVRLRGSAQPIGLYFHHHGHLGQVSEIVSWEVCGKGGPSLKLYLRHTCSQQVSCLVKIKTPFSAVVKKITPCPFAKTGEQICSFDPAVFTLLSCTQVTVFIKGEKRGEGGSFKTHPSMGRLTTRHRRNLIHSGSIGDAAMTPTLRNNDHEAPFVFCTWHDKRVRVSI